MKKIWKGIMSFLPSVIMLAFGAYLLGAAQTQTIAGWVLTILGVLGVIGSITMLFKG